MSPLHHLGPVVGFLGFMFGLLLACRHGQVYPSYFGVCQPCFTFAMVWLSLCLALGFWLVVSFSCFACSRMDFLVCFGLPRAHPRPFPVGCSQRHALRVLPIVRLLIACAFVRVGEAKVPGPCFEWKIGHCNPAGLPNKAHLFTDSDVDLWLVSESHLSSQGFRKFQQQMKDEHSPYRWHIPGKHVMPRSTTSDHGSWTGVLAMSSHPTRRLPHSWHPRIFDTSRIMACTTHCFGMWVSGVVVYGVPGGPTHPNARASTSALLQEGINRVGAMSGPRYIAGDWNHDLDSLPCVDNLKEMQFVEVQELHYQLTGCPPQPTCRRKTRRDFLFISPELVPMFQGVEINHHHWIDHASVIAQFRGNVEVLVRYPWPQPSPMPWTNVRNDEPGHTVSFDDGDCTQLYQQFWDNVEQRALRGLSDVGSMPLSKCVGRGRRLRPKRVTVQTGPVKAARSGEVDPTFFGISHLHRHWFRQLRRLQSMIRLLKSPIQGVSHAEHRCNLWRSILTARGFAPSFCEWWPTRPVIVHPNAVITSAVPSWQVAQLIFEDLQKQVADLERHLNSSRRSGSKATPAHALTALYRAVKRDAPAQVDVLFQSKQSTIREIVYDDVAIIVDPPQEWDEHLPLVVQGLPITPTYVTADCLWLESIQSLEVGQVLTQTRGVGRLDCVFEVFIDYWSKFWCKHADTPISHWDTILQFARDRLPRISVEPLNITVPLVRATLKSKKARSARGLDGVGRDDVLNLTSNEMQSLVSLYNRAALTGEWPCQVVQGLVKSLAKKPDPMDAPDYRPISIFSVVYRLWSSMQSRFWLGRISNVLSSTLSGNRNGHQASTLWRRVLEEVEFGHGFSQSTCGLILDLAKAFNTLPRLPCLAMCMVCGMDSGSINAWAGALGLMTRRFWVNGSVSRAATAVVVEHDLGPNTLSQVLLQRIQVLGWTIDSAGLVHDVLGCFSLLQASWVDVVQRIQIAWHGVVAAQIVHRSDFAGFGSVDVAGTRQFLASLGAYDAGVHRHNLVGMTLTNEHSCFWSDNGQVQCCFCDQRDSLRHRYWECPHSTDLREALDPMVRDIVPTLPEVLTIRGWSIESSYQLAWQKYLCSLPDSIPIVSCPAFSGDRVNIFTDGSCLWPTCPQYRLAAWGVTFAPGLTLEPSALDSQVLSAGVVPGLVQTAYRAELYAVMVAMTLLERWQCKGRIWLDCQSVLDRFHMYVFGGKRINPNGPHHDLWTEICRIVDVSGSDVVEFVKVSAHTVWTGETPAALRWAIVHNSCVDRVAKLANQLREEEAWSLWKRHSAMVHQAALVSNSIQQHQLAVHRKWHDGGSGGAPRLLTPRAPKQGKVFSFGMGECDSSAPHAR